MRSTSSSNPSNSECQWIIINDPLTIISIVGSKEKEKRERMFDIEFDEPPPYPGPKKKPSTIQGKKEFENLPPAYLGWSYNILSKNSFSL